MKLVKGLPFPKLKSKAILRNQFGFGLVEVMTTSVIAAILSLTIGTMIVSSTRQTKQISFAADADSFSNELNWFLSEPFNCSYSLNGLNAANQPTGITTLKRNTGPSTPPADAYQVGTANIGQSRMKIVEYRLKDGDGTSVANNTTHLYVTLEATGISAQAQVGATPVPTRITRRLRVFVNVTGGNIDTCRTLGGQEDVWTRNSATPNNIFYNLGFVGIGTSNPQAVLDVGSTDGTIPGFMRINASDSVDGGAILFGAEAGNITNQFLLQNRGGAGAGYLSIRSFNQSVTPVVEKELFVIKNAGLVGIGTTDPRAALSISSNQNQLILLDANGTNNSTMGGTLLGSNNGLFTVQGIDHATNGSTIRLWVDQSTGETRHYADSGQSLILRTVTNAANESLSFNAGGRASFGYDGAKGAVSITDRSPSNVSTGKNIIFETDGTERIRIEQGTGDVGIGAMNPEGRLHVRKSGVNATPSTTMNELILEADEANVGVSILGGVNSTTGVVFGGPNGAYQGYLHYDNQNERMSFGTNNTDKMHITSAGRVGIGTNSPNSSLSVVGTSNQLTLLDSNSTNTTNTGGTLISSDAGYLTFRGVTSAGGTHTTPRFVINQNNGTVGVGTAVPASTLHIEGGVKIGYEGPCTAAKDGTIRYVAASKQLQFCDGVTWKPLSDPGASCASAGGVWNVTTFTCVFSGGGPCSCGNPISSFSCQAGQAPNGSTGSGNQMINGVLNECTYTCSSGSWVQQSCFDATPTCFTHDTLVTMADGNKKRISEVRVGEYVMGENGNLNRVTGIDHTRLGGRRLLSMNGSDFFATDDHPMGVATGWAAFRPERVKTKLDSPAQQLVPGQIMKTERGPEVLMSMELKHDDPNTPLIQLHLDGDHTYYVNDYLTHNCSVGGN